MKILALMTFDIFRLSLGDALRDLGHFVKVLGEFDAESLDREIASFQPDMVVDMGWDIWQQDKYFHGQLHAIHDVMKRHDVFHLYFAEEDWLHFDRWSKRYCEIMKPSFVLTRSPHTIRRYEDMGIPATYFDVGCNPNFHKPSPIKHTYQCDIAIVANGNFDIGEIRYRSINDLVVPLFNQSWDVKIWGRDWEGIDRCYPGVQPSPTMLYGKLPFQETPHVYSSAKICISIQTCNDQLSNRTFDVLASGAFLLTSDTKAVREKLLPGVNCAVSGSPTETIRMIDYYLRHETERQKIAHEGLKIARESYAYQKTLAIVWPVIGAKWREHQHRKSRPKANNILRSAWTYHHAKPIVAMDEERHGKRQKSIEFAGGSTNAYIQQTVSVKPGFSYLLTARFKRAADGSGAPVKIYVQYYNEAHKLLSFGLYHSLFPTDFDDKWFVYRGITVSVPEETSYALVLINKFPHPSSSSLLMSDCTMIKIRHLGVDHDAIT